MEQRTKFACEGLARAFGEKCIADAKQAGGRGELAARVGNRRNLVFVVIIKK
jgi:hypothetical protein